MRKLARVTIARSLVLPGADGLAGAAAAPTDVSPAPQAQGMSAGPHRAIAAFRTSGQAVC